eukprot:4712988-Amphidinium_carterae.3
MVSTLCCIRSTPRSAWACCCDRLKPCSLLTCVILSNLPAFVSEPAPLPDLPAAGFPPPEKCGPLRSRPMTAALWSWPWAPQGQAPARFEPKCCCPATALYEALGGRWPSPLWLRRCVVKVTRGPGAPARGMCCVSANQLLNPLTQC